MKAYAYIRFSTKKQEHGYSYQRQLDDAKKACNAFKWTLDNNLHLDLGVSAFRGKHKKQGALSVFLSLIESGGIKKGSVLIVESIDRLSRENPYDALDTFTNLIRQQIHIYVVNLSTLFTKEDGHLLHLAVSEFNRANAESKRKSDLGIDNWKRKFSEKNLLTRKLPSWLRVEDGTIQIIHENAKIINHIFSLSVKGYGGMAIAIKLNKDNIKPIGKSKNWYESYIHKILTNRQVLGEFQPRLDKKAYGEVKHIYPAIIKETLFLKSQQARDKRKETRGRVGKHITNLFSQLIFDDAGNPYNCINVAGRRYLINREALRGNAPYLQVPYYPFETAMLEWLQEITITYDNNDDNLNTLNARLHDINKRLTVLIAEVATKNIASFITSIKHLEKQKQELTIQIENHRKPDLPETQNAIERLAKASDKEEARREIKQKIRLTIDKIVMDVLGNKKGRTKLCSCQIFFSNKETRWLYVRTTANNNATVHAYYDSKIHKRMTAEWKKLLSILPH